MKALLVLPFMVLLTLNLVAGDLVHTLSSASAQKVPDQFDYSKIIVTNVFVNEESHGGLWAKYSELTAWQSQRKSYIESVKETRQKQMSEYNAAKSVLEENASELTAKITALQPREYKSIDIEKGEFETTAEWDQRRQNALEARNSEIRSSLSDLKTALDACRGKISSLIEPSKNWQPLEDTETGSGGFHIDNSVRFCVPVTMGSYNADNQTVNGFSHANMRVVNTDASNPKYFILKGDLNGVPVLIEKAKVIRRASDDGELWAYFDAVPDDITFESGYYKTESTSETYTRTVKNTDMPTGKTLATRGAIILLGTLFGASQETMQPACDSVADTKEIAETREVQKQVWHSGQVIKLSWRNPSTPNILKYYNHTTKQWDTIWP